MSELDNYRKAKSVQINLDDGKKVLLSYGATDMRVFLLGYFLSAKTIHVFDSGFLSKLISKIGLDLSKDVVKILADELVKASSVEQLKNLCVELEQNENFIKHI